MGLVDVEEEISVPVRVDRHHRHATDRLRVPHVRRSGQRPLVMKHLQVLVVDKRRSRAQLGQLGARRDLPIAGQALRNGRGNGEVTGDELRRRRRRRTRHRRVQIERVLRGAEVEVGIGRRERLRAGQVDVAFPGQRLEHVIELRFGLEHDRLVRDATEEDLVRSGLLLFQQVDDEFAEALRAERRL